jgi:ankyrin repeat protein
MLQADAVLTHDTERDRREALSRIPVNLSTIYTATLERIQQQPEKRAERAFLILNWVVCAQRQLRVIELRHALAVKTGDTAFNPTGMPPENALTDCCLGLVVIERETSTVRLTHFTLQEYFDDHREFLNPSGHTMIANTCLTYLSFNHTGYTRHQLEESSPFIEYVGSNVGHHLRKGSDEETDKRIISFLSNNEKLQILEFFAAFSYFHPPSHIPPLHWVAFFGIASAARLLLNPTDAGNNPDTMRRDFWATISSGILGSLSNPNSNLNARDSYDRTPLSLAARNGYDTVVRLLINTPGIDLNARDNHGQTALSRAAESDHDEVVQLLINTPGIELNARDNYGRTPLSWAAGNGHDTVVRLVINTPGIDLNVRDNYGRTPLSWAAENGRDAVVRLLINAPGIELNTGDRVSRTSLSLAAANGYDVVVQLLINTPGIDLNARDNYGHTSLSWAAENDRDAVVRLLINAPGIEPNTGDNFGRTSLSWAAGNGHDTVVRLLINTPGIDLNTRDNFGRTSLSWAAKNGHDAVVQLLSLAIDNSPN